MKILLAIVLVVILMFGAIYPTIRMTTETYTGQQRTFMIAAIATGIMLALSIINIMIKLMQRRELVSGDGVFPTIFFIATVLLILFADRI